MSINIFEFNVRRFEGKPFDIYDLLLLTDDHVEEGVADVKPVPMKDILFNDAFKKKPRDWRRYGYLATAEFYLPVTNEPNSPKDIYTVSIRVDRRGADIVFSHDGGASPSRGFSSQRAGAETARSADFSNRLFATVVAIIKKFIKSHKPAGLSFSSAGRGRTKLYKRLVRMFGGDFEDAGTYVDPGDRGASFRLKRRGVKTLERDLLFITDVPDNQKVVFLKDHRSDSPLIILPSGDTKEVDNAQALLARHQQELERRSTTGEPIRGVEREIEKAKAKISKAKRDMKMVERINMAAYEKAVKAIMAKKKRLQKAGSEDFIEIAEVTTAKKAIEMLVMRGLKRGTKIQLANYPGTMAFVKGFMRKGLV